MCYIIPAIYLLKLNAQTFISGEVVFQIESLALTLCTVIL